MDTKWIPNGQQLEIERMTQGRLLNLHWEYISKCMAHDLWTDISHTHEYKMRELLHREIIIRRDAI